MGTKLKTNFSVENRYPAFYTGGHIHVTTDGQYLFSICDRKINVVDVTTGIIHTTLAEDDEDDISCFTVSPDDSTLVVARRSFRIQQYEWRTHTLVRTWKALHTAPILCMDIDPTTTLLATGSSDLSVKVCDIIQKYYTHNFKANQGIVSLVRFHPDISRLHLFSVSGDNKIRAWSLTTSQLIHALDKHHSTVTDLHFVNNDVLISASRDSIVVVWDLNTWAALRTIPIFEPIEGITVFPESTDLTHYNLRPHAQHFITAGQRGQLRVWDTKSGACTYTQDPIVCRRPKDSDQTAVIVQVVARESTHSLTVVTYDQNLLVYSAADLTLTKQLVGYSDDVLDIKFMGVTNSHVAVVTNSEELKVFEVSSWDCRLLRGHTDIVLSVDVQNKHCLLVSGAKDNTIRLWSFSDLANIRCIALLQGHVHAVGAVTFSRVSGEFVVSGSQDCTVKRWDIASQLVQSTDMVNSVAAITAQGHAKDINSVVMADNDSLIATGSLDKTIKVWQPSDLSLLGVMRGHSRSVWCVQFSPVDKCLVSGSADGSIKIWSLMDYTCVKTFEGHDCSVLWVSFITAGLQLLSSGSDGLVKLWTIKNNECVGTFDEHDGKVWSVAISDDQQMLLSGGSDSTLIRWQDVTLSDREDARKKQEQFILMDQELTNLVLEKNFSKAVRLALRLEQPFRLLTIFKQMLDSFGGTGQLEDTVKSLRHDQLDTLMRFAAEWNKNSKHCDVAQLVMSHILRHLHPQDLLALPNIKSSLEAFIPYTDRHYERLKRVRQQAKFVEYTWSCMRPVTDTLLRSDGGEKMEVDGVNNGRHVTPTPSLPTNPSPGVTNTSSPPVDEGGEVMDVAVTIRKAAARRADIEN